MRRLHLYQGANASALIPHADGEYVTYVEVKQELATLHARIAALLDHCPDAECATCAAIICPHDCGLHYHHDGCPACAEHEENPA